MDSPHSAADAQVRGGPAKVAIFACPVRDYFGSAPPPPWHWHFTTILLMKKVKQAVHFAGVVEAVASTGGQITCPRIAARRLIMADVIGVSYSDHRQGRPDSPSSYYLTLLAIIHLLKPSART